MSAIAQDLRYAVRVLARNRGYAAVGIATLALGIGASTAIFSVVNTVLLQPMPFSEPERLVYLRESRLPQFPEFSVAPGNFLTWQAQNQTFASMAAYGGQTLNLTGSDEPERLAGDRTTANLFALLGVQPVLGRVFRPEEDAPGAPPVVILSHGLWQRRFGADPAVVGRVILLNGTGHTIVGVMPATMATLRPSTELWVPMAFTEEERQRYGSHYLRAIGRLAPGATLEQARADLETIALRLEAEYPDEDTGWRVLAAPLQGYFVRGVRPTLLILVGAVGLVLIVACSNVANLLLARGAGRQKELAIRAAMGAARRRLVGQLLTESVIVALAGGAVGLAVARWLLGALVALAPSALPRADAIGLDWTVVGFAFALAAVTPLVFGLVPSLQVSRAELRDTLAAGGRTGQGGVRRRTRRVLVVTEVALAAVLLVGSGLLIRSFLSLRQVDPGFVAANALVASVALPEATYAEPATAYDFYRRLLDQVAALPGVDAAGATASLPFAGDYVGGLVIEGRPPVPPTEWPPANYYQVTPGFFDAMGIRLVRGRLFTAADGPNAPRVAVINETFAKRLFPGEDPIGRRVKISMGPDAWREVVGIVRDTKHYGLDQDASNQFYEPHGQLTYRNMTLVVRTAGDPAAITSALRGAIRAVDPDVPMNQARRLADLVAESLVTERFSAVLLGVFAASALFLAAIGLYGVMAYTVGQRTVEIGVRMAHGARPSDVVTLVLREGLGLAAAGAALGLAISLAGGRLVSSLLFGVTSVDPLTFIVGPALLIALAAAACAIPAWRAARIDPVVALRAE